MLQGKFWVRAGVVKSFLQVPGITAVRFTVENEELLDSRGNPVGDMTEDTFADLQEMSRMPIAAIRLLCILQIRKEPTW